MANRNFKDGPRSLEHGLVRLVGSITVNSGGVNGGTVLSQNIKGLTASATGSDAGRIVFTLEDAYSSMLNASFSVYNTGSQVYHCILSASNVTAATGSAGYSAKQIEASLVTLTGSIPQASPSHTWVRKLPSNAVTVFCDILLKNSNV